MISEVIGIDGVKVTPGLASYYPSGTVISNNGELKVVDYNGSIHSLTGCPSYVQLTPEVKELLEWCKQRKLQEEEAMKIPAIKESYEHFQLMLKIGAEHAG